jgi:transposase
MLKVDQYDYIRTAHRVYGKKIRQIAKETGHSKNTVKKVLRGEYSGYTPRSEQPYPVLGSFVNIIDKWLTDDKDQPRKQRHTAARIYRRLKKEHGFTGAETTIRKYVKSAKLRLGLSGQQAFIPCSPTIGGEAEVDWGTCVAVIAGNNVRLKIFCMRSKYSGKHFVRCYPCERQQALFDAHIQAFTFFGGVFPILIYDNLTTAVQKVYQGKKRDLQMSFAKFLAYHNFTPRFCNRNAGHEKGGVEGLVGYARRNYMVPVPHAESLKALNERLLMECIAYGDHRMATRQQKVNELYEAEKGHLIDLPEVEFSNIEVHTPKVDKYATVIIDKNHYSVPTRYVHVRAKAIAYVDRLYIYYGTKKIASHNRLYNNNQWCLDPAHYLELIQQRPQAFDTARPIVQWRKSWPTCLEKLLERFCRKQGTSNGIKDFITVLMLHEHFTASEIETAVELALIADVGSSAAVEYILRSESRPADQPVESVDNWPRFAPADVSIYEQIGGDV